MKRLCAIACLTLIGLGSISSVYAQEQSLIGEWTDDLVAELCIDDESVPNLLNQSEAKAWAKAKGILCRTVVDEVNPPAPEGMEVYDATGGTERRQAEASLVGELDDAPLFEFDSLLPAPKYPNNSGLDQESQQDYGMRDPILDAPIRSDPGLEKAKGGVDFDAQMAARTGDVIANSASNSQSAAKSGPVELGDIYGARRQIVLDAAKNELFTKSQQIVTQCQCVFNRTECYKTKGYQFDELDTVVSKTKSNMEPQRSAVCNGWLANLRGKTSDNQDVLNRYLQDTNKVLRNLTTLDSSYLGLLAQLDQKQVEIKNEFRRREALQRKAYEQQNAGPSGWQIAGALGGAALIASSGLPTEQATKLGSAFIKDMLSDGSGTSMMNIMQVQGYGAANNYELEVPDYESDDLGTEPKPGTVKDHVLVYESPKNLSQGDAASIAATASASSAAGSYGIMIFGVGGNDGALITHSRPSSAQAESEAFQQCGAVCSGRTQHEYFGPGQCVALVTGRWPSRSESTKYWRTGNSLSAAQNAAGGECNLAREAAGIGGAMSCILAASACN